MPIRSLVLTAAGALALAAPLATLSAAPALADSRSPCFFINQWQGWRAPNDHTIYLRVNLNEIYRVDLSAGSQQLTWPGSYHLVSKVRGSSSICGPLDLQLALADGHGYYQPLIARDLVKLTPEEAAALPKKDRP